jgi:hypothetical protein
LIRDLEGVVEEVKWEIEMGKVYEIVNRILSMDKGGFEWDLEMVEMIKSKVKDPKPFIYDELIMSIKEKTRN